MQWNSMLLALVCFSTSPLIAQTQDPTLKPKPTRPLATVANFAYGNDSPRQLLDFWQARSDSPTPLLLYIHGGGWNKGDKRNHDVQLVVDLLEAGISVASINYRLIQNAMEQNVEPPVKACMHDAARALQTIRFKAKEWNVDPKRIGASGSSAGACTALWLAMHDDLADAQSSDPIARQSTRLTCAAVSGGQTTLDPWEARSWIPNAVYGGHAFGYAAEGRDRAGEFALAYENRDKLIPWIKEYSPIELATSDDPPLFLDYPDQKGLPVVGEVQIDQTHSAVYGIKLREKLQSLGVEVILTYPDHPDEKYGSFQKFFITKLKR